MLKFIETTCCARSVSPPFILSNWGSNCCRNCFIISFIPSFLFSNDNPTSHPIIICYLRGLISTFTYPLFRCALQASAMILGYSPFGAESLILPMLDYVYITIKLRLTSEVGNLGECPRVH